MSAIKWKRPESVPYPSVWLRFEGKREINGKIPKFWIQDIPEELFEKSLEIMCENFLIEEPLNKSSNFIEDKVSIEEIKEAWRGLLKHKVGLICFMENEQDHTKPVIAGLNMTYIIEKDEPKPKFQGQVISKIVNAIMYLCTIKDPFKLFGVNEYMSAFGLSVLPEFRRQGIGDRLLEARFLIGKAVNLKVTITVFTAIASQKIAERVGFQDIVNIPYDDLEKINPQYSFPGITSHTKNIRFMYKLIE